jgi:glycosyltransferase involved in cell wall biosynthesis
VEFADKWVADERGIRDDGGRIYTLDDVYQQADLVTYPSEYEGFGNAFLEAVYFRRPIVCKRYPIFRRDIEPCGFRTIAFDDFITSKLVKDVDRLLADPRRVAEMVEHNYGVARQHFSYEVLEDELRPLLRRVLTGCPNRR